MKTKDLKGKYFFWRIEKFVNTQGPSPVWSTERVDSYESPEGIIARHLYYQSVMDEELYLKGTLLPEELSIQEGKDGLPVIKGYADFMGYSMVMTASALRTATEVEKEEQDKIDTAEEEKRLKKEKEREESGPDLWEALKEENKEGK